MFGLNWVDAGFIVVLLYFVLSSHGFIQVLLEFLGLFISMIAAYVFYTDVGGVVTSVTNLPSGIAEAGGFFITWFIVESLVQIAIRFTLFPFLRPLLYNKVNKFFGYLAGAFQGMLFFLFVISLVFALPVRGNVKQAVLESESGRRFVSVAQQFEGSIKNIFGNAIVDSLNFLTVKPDSNARVDLKFKSKAKDLRPDPTSENLMLDLLNRQRLEVGRKPLVMDHQMQAVARDYAREMLIHGFFSHTSALDNSTPADRVERAGIDYLVVGENLAYAPDVYLAHRGLMNSPGHKANILSADYGRVGIGVIDAGIYGRMFVQQFKN